MKTLNKLTIKNLLFNKKRSVMTIIGIALSVALITTVLGLFTTFYKCFIDYTIFTEGNYHARLYDVEGEKQKYITENPDIKSFYQLQSIGYIKLDTKPNKYYPYLHVITMDDAGFKEGGLNIVEGRAPENEHEIVIPQNLKYLFDDQYNIGDEITVEVGDRYFEGKKLSYLDFIHYDPSGYETLVEDFVPRFTEKYTIVGIMDYFSLDDFAGGIAITKAPIQEGPITYAFLLKKPKVVGYQVSLINEKIDAPYDYNITYLELLGKTDDDSTYQTLFFIVGTIVAIILISTIFVIRNSFAISTTEKTQQYGMLRSLGATKKQIRRSVLFEGLIYGLIAIPLGILLGILATFILMHITNVLLSGELPTAFKLHFYFPLINYLIIITLGGITIFLSSISSAIRSSKITPIQAIRNQKDIAYAHKKYLFTNIIRRLFGIGGEIAYFNMNRNAKKYRTTIISLTISIIIVIIFASFLHYSQIASHDIYAGADYNIEVFNFKDLPTREDYEKLMTLYETIAHYEGVKQAAILRGVYMQNDDFSAYTEYGTNHIEELNFVRIYSLGEEAYRKYLQTLNLDYEEVKDKIIHVEGNGTFTTKGVHEQYIDREKFTSIKLSDQFEQSYELAVVDAEKAPFGLGTDFSNVYGLFIVSDAMMDTIIEPILNDDETNKESVIDNLKIDAEDAYDLEKKIDDQEFSNIEVTNIQSLIDSDKRMLLWITIFVYGFTIIIFLIGLTNIFNTITTNMQLRSKEFAMLKSIGMSKRDFTKMICLESVFYCFKSLLFGLMIGLFVNYYFREAVNLSNSAYVPYYIPIREIIITTLIILGVIFLIMNYSLRKINRQNIIETIRQDNI